MRYLHIIIIIINVNYLLSGVVHKFYYLLIYLLIVTIFSGVSSASKEVTRLRKI